MGFSSSEAAVAIHSGTQTALGSHIRAERNCLMSSCLLRRCGKDFVIFIFAIILTTMISDTAECSRGSAPIEIAWSNSRGDIVVYKVLPAKIDQVEVQLITGRKIIDTDTKPWPGGIDGLLALTERASRETVRVSGEAAKGKFWRRLTVKYGKGVARRSFSVQGEANDLLLFFYGTENLKSLLRLVSGDAPKAYRLINEGQETMFPPGQSPPTKPPN